ncbi:MAG: hypothetical protein Q7S74_05635 [Nanoarchaeota archaeon]|nr:hypothetical protein [Nanoarchaeota archaeon]
MTEMKIEISNDLKEEIARHPEIAWAKIFEKAAKEELIEIAKRRVIFSALNKLLENSTLTEKDAEELSERVKESMHKRLKEEGIL